MTTTQPIRSGAFAHKDIFQPVWAQPVTAEQVRKAQIAVADRAESREELAMLLDMLGILRESDKITERVSLPDLGWE